MNIKITIEICTDKGHQKILPDEQTNVFIFEARPDWNPLHQASAA